MKYAFRCKTCGHLETAAQAGESEQPHACSVCGSGVSFDTRSGVKTFNKDNWEILSSATYARLKELGLTQEEVEKHVPLQPSGNIPKNVSVTAMEGVGAKDKGA